MKQKILTIPGVEYFGSWELLQGFLEFRGNPPWRCDGNLDLSGTNIKHLNNLVSVGGDLNLYKTPIKSLGSLQSVGGYLDLCGTPLAKKYTKEQIRKIIDVKDDIFLK